jgi:type III restriction enzyme
MNRCVNAISGRLSLREPQRRALEILARVVEIAPPEKGQDVELALEVIRSEYPQVTEFERDFPSLCFALATGVGKTRLMGAFVAYLHLMQGVRHFFVLAPNLTIYNKLIRDFTPGSPKYVLQGIAEFATEPPEIITGENYESGRGVRRASLFGECGVHINIFNISKINAEVRGGNAPRIKRLSEYIGQSYFEYLAGLDDLVLLMDESHRYRADAGMRAISELKPILGLELTATPYREISGGQQRFKNVIYSYSLAEAIGDGFVKRPAVATQENFDARRYSDEQLERLKLEDGVRIHEEVKGELEVYAAQNGQPAVKPFMLVVARDTDHADVLEATIKDEAFFDGRYRDGVITVHSNQRGEERDETVERLLAVEKPKEPTEIVIHVNMLKEGWDVTNLYTIVPLRRADSRTLVEQSIGRGLRLPYGRRTGVSAVDRLIIVAHDRFQEIVDEANRPDSVIRHIDQVFIGRDVGREQKTPMTVRPVIEERITRTSADGGQQALLFEKPAEQQAAVAVWETLQQMPRRPAAAELRSPEMQARLVRETQERYVVGQGALEEVAEEPDLPAVVDKVTALYEALTIDIPRIVVVPRDEPTTGFEAFDLDLTRFHSPQPMESDILIQELQSNERHVLARGTESADERRLEDYVVRRLIEFDDICYDEHADLLYRLTGQLVAYLHRYLPDEEAVRRVIRQNERSFAQLIHQQMDEHVWNGETRYDAAVSHGYVPLRPIVYSASADEPVREFRAPVEEKQYIRGMLFGGFQRCVYPMQRFDVDPERRLAMILDTDREVLKWVKPGRNQFQIFYRADKAYEPDFVVETKTAKLLCEPKRESEMEDAEVLEKARAAVAWCRHATEHEEAHGGKRWSYLLIPHNEITAGGTLQGLAARFTRKDG